MMCRAVPLLVNVFMHSPQTSESMKKFDGMIPPTLVLAEEGKNLELGPPPSSCIVAGTWRGLRIRSDDCGNTRR